MNTFASLFTGGGGADVGAAQAGYTHLWGVEYDPKIASVAALNGFAPLVADVIAVDFTALAAPHWLHMSPPCTRASQANSGAEESPLDQALADACIRAIRTLRPRRISLENVWGYRNFQAFRSILAALASEGYCTDVWHLNAADYGVPQTRKRLMLVASLDHTPRRPEPTHYDASAGYIHMLYQPWRGWYAAIEDLIPTLPESQFAPWQLARLPQELKETMLIGNSGYEGTLAMADQATPAFTVTSNINQNSLRAFLTNTNQTESGILTATPDDPAFTVLGSSTRLRAFVVDCQESGSASGLTNREAGQPMYTLSATMEPRRPARAFVISGGNTNTTEGRDRLPRYDDEPAFTVSGSSNRDRAFIVPGENATNGSSARLADEPAYTLSASAKGATRAYVGRVVKMTPRCLARFNGLPDSYQLPASNTLACTVLGNMHMPAVQRAAMEANQ